VEGFDVSNNDDEIVPVHERNCLTIIALKDFNIIKQFKLSCGQGPVAVSRHGGSQLALFGLY
jgi:hypothetical protein